ncbi:MAG: cysteine hydrolase, partial [Proteobacteria bacterium]|nr:cysteine hydrolase [Pseudomonadota bacterium]
MTLWSPECGDAERSCWPGHRRRYADRPHELEGSEVVDEIMPRPDELIVDKYGYGAFHNTILRDALRAQNCDQVVVCGVITQICVEDTVRQGFHHGLEMVVVHDAVADRKSFLLGLHQADIDIRGALDLGQVQGSGNQLIHRWHLASGEISPNNTPWTGLELHRAHPALMSLRPAC